MDERRGRELQLVKAACGCIEVAPDLSWFIIPEVVLPPGWSLETTDLLILIPPGYPMTAPDNFFTDNALRLANGQLPRNTSTNVSHAGRAWLQFSYHLEAGDWQPHADPEQGHNLLTFVAGVGARLKEIS